MFALARLPAALGTRATARAVIAITLAVVFWEIGSRFGDWTGARLPFIGVVPPPSRVLSVWYNLIGDYGYWQSWYLSFSVFLAVLAQPWCWEFHSAWH